jgi:hypothetical protein
MKESRKKGHALRWLKRKERELQLVSVLRLLLPYNDGNRCGGSTHSPPAEHDRVAEWLYISLIDSLQTSRMARCCLVLDMTGGQYVGGSGGGRGGTGDCRREMGRCASLAWCTAATCYGVNILVQPGLVGHASRIQNHEKRFREKTGGSAIS